MLRDAGARPLISTVDDDGLAVLSSLIAPARQALDAAFAAGDQQSAVAHLLLARASITAALNAAHSLSR